MTSTQALVPGYRNLAVTTGRHREADSASRARWLPAVTTPTTPGAAQSTQVRQPSNAVDDSLAVEDQSSQAVPVTRGAEGTPQAVQSETYPITCSPCNTHTRGRPLDAALPVALILVGAWHGCDADLLGVGYLALRAAADRLASWSM